MRLVPQERAQQRIDKQPVKVPVSQGLAGIVEVVRFPVPRVAEQLVDVPKIASLRVAVEKQPARRPEAQESKWCWQWVFDAA